MLPAQIVLRRAVMGIMGGESQGNPQARRSRISHLDLGESSPAVCDIRVTTSNNIFSFCQLHCKLSLVSMESQRNS